MHPLLGRVRLASIRNCGQILLLLLSVRGIPVWGEQIPAGTPIEIRLTRRIDSHKDSKGAPVEAVLIAPVIVGGVTLLPLGSKVLGTIEDVHGVGLGFKHETAAIALQMDRVILPDGTALVLETRVAQVENSREAVNKKGVIQGIRSTGTLSHKASGAMGALAFSNPVALIFTTAASGAVLRFSDPEISLPADSELMLVLTAAVTVEHATPSATPAVAADGLAQQRLRKLVRSEPFRTVTDGKHVPSDLTNLMLIGPDDGIVRAFRAAGWLQVSALDAASSYQTVRSISEQQAYRTAPMSTLLLEGKPPVHTLAKTLDTFSKRHHLRIFSTPDEWLGERVWLSSSTQDIGIGFSAGKKTLIHQIDHNIDHERAKAVNDLMLTGCVTGLNMVGRPWLPKDPLNGTGEPIVTDGGMAVVRVDACLSPEHVPPSDQTADVTPRQNKAAHVTRQTVLTLRNTLLRDNIGVTAYGGIKTALAARHPKPPEQPLTMSTELSAQQYDIEAKGAEDEDTGLKRRDPLGEPGTIADYRPEGPRAKFAPSTIELGIHSGYAGYGGGNGGYVGYILQDATDPVGNPAIILALANEHSGGWNLGGSVTVNAHRYFSNEFTFDYNRTGFRLEFAALPIGLGDDTTDPSTQTTFSFQDASLSTTEVGYNLLIHARPKGSRFRPYVFLGPSFRLMHLTEAPVTKASPWFKLGLSTVGSITAAYHFGTTPPLDGGGLFQFGFQYGAGVKYRVARRWLLRADYKETLSGQPDFWSKSTNEVFNQLALPGYSLTVIGPGLEGKMRQQRATMGFSFVF